MPYYVYILLCGDGSYYTGHTDNVERRFALHRSGSGGRYTRSHRPVEVLHVEEFATRGDAMRREHEIKSYGRDGREKIVRSGFAGARWVFFDLGSTLTDEGVFERFMFREVYRFLVRSDLQVTRRCFNRAVREAVSAEEYRQRSENLTYGTGYRGLIGAAVRRLVGGDGYAEAAVRYYCDSIKPFYPKKQMVRKGARAVLRKLAKKYRLGLVCNQPSESRELLKKLGLEKLFGVVVISDDVGVNKPDPKIFSLALGEAGCGPEEAVMVGDRLDNDAAPAKSLGMKTVHIKTGLAAKQKPSCEFEKADCSLYNLKSLLEVL